MTERPSKRSDVFERSLEDEAVLYDPSDSVMHTLNPVAVFIWKMCDGKHTPEDIARAVCEVYDADPDAVLKDVESTLDEFRAKKLLQA
jgi:hypothetical protein